MIDLDFINYSPEGQEIALAWYEAGVRVGHTSGYLKAMDDIAAEQRLIAAVALGCANNPDFAELARRRGDALRLESALADAERIMRSPSPLSKEGGRAA